MDIALESDDVNSHIIIVLRQPDGGPLVTDFPFIPRMPTEEALEELAREIRLGMADEVRNAFTDTAP